MVNYVEKNMIPSRPQSLTEGQQRVLDFILSRQREAGIPPTRREIQQALQLTSETSVVQFLRSLVKKGFVRVMPGKARGITAVVPGDAGGPIRPDGRPLFIDVPLLGDIQAGLPSDAFPEVQNKFPVHAASMGLTAQSKPFALRARGDSMTGKGILDGDYIVLDAARLAQSGDVVAALLDGETTLKTYVANGKKPYLKAANPKYANMVPKRGLQVQGVMVGLIRGNVTELR